MAPSSVWLQREVETVNTDMMRRVLSIAFAFALQRKSGRFLGAQAGNAEDVSERVHEGR
jgi:hypothetical protein